MKKGAAIDELGTGFKSTAESGDHSLIDTIDVAHDPPIEGMENDRIPRQESYVKDFRPLYMGRINLQAGQGLLTVKALDLPGGGGPDIRRVMLKRVD